VARRRDQRGQAAVEAALTLPLIIFLMLGTLQLFLMFQARIAAEYAVFRAVRVGSTNSAQCRPMMDAAVLALLPTFKTYLKNAPAANLATAFRKYGPAGRYRYDDDFDKGTAVTNHLSRSILLMQRRFARAVVPAGELEFDQPGPPQRLEVRLVFWYPMRIPFANWVISKMVLGYSAANPLMLTQKASWDASGDLNSFAPVVASRAAAGEYVLPVVAEYSMRMMSPVEDNAATCGGT
jgi:hypothetical protein